MRILIVEDEAPAARMLKNMLGDILKGEAESVRIQRSLRTSRRYIWEHRIDLLFLDLDLNGEDGLDVLTCATAGAFHCIVVSAHHERALESFEYGVLDFVAKPYREERIEKALERYRKGLSDSRLKFVSIVREGKALLVPLEAISHIQADNRHSVIFEKDGTQETCNKMLHDLQKILPSYYARIHRSFIVNMGEVRQVTTYPDRRHSVLLKSGTDLPVSRGAYKVLKERFGRLQSQ
jgi:DNA-binding LytR/AlgR family response regulator